MSLEQRKNPRIDFRLSVMIKGYEGQTEIQDLSLGGVFIRVENPSQFRHGDEIDLVMQLPFEKDAMEVKAKITRVTAEGVGVEYVDLLPQHTMALEQCFHIFKHTMPIARN
jgi:c-di-GMP-binding flagellar brake protein YcgR